MIGRNLNAKKLKVVPPSRANARQACNFGLLDENRLKPPSGMKIKSKIMNAPQYLAKINWVVGNPYKISHFAELSINVNSSTANAIRRIAKVGWFSRCSPELIIEIVWSCSDVQIKSIDCPALSLRYVRGSFLFLIKKALRFWTFALIKLPELRWHWLKFPCYWEKSSVLNFEAQSALANKPWTLSDN